MNQHFHFLGICGTAMGAVAAAMARKGYKVTGTDEKVYPPMSTFLESEGITIFEGYKGDNVPDSADVIVIGNAMSRGNDEVEAVLESRRRYLSLPETMKEYFLRGKRNYVVTGTHGKTTTTSMLAWLMEYAGLNPGFMIGGISRNLKRGGRFTESEFCVLEGDEYDTAFFDKRSKFLHYLPELVIMNNIEFDHADIYESEKEIMTSFKRLLRVVPRNGLAIVNADDKNCMEVVRDHPPCPVKTLGFSEQSDMRIEDVDCRKEGSFFTLDGERYFVPMVGECNVYNAAMALTAARFAGLEPSVLQEGMKQFLGVARRQEERGVVDGIAVIDDFAHHPTAIRKSIEALRQRYPQSRIWALFEPRSNTSRRNIFQKELAEAMACADVPVVAAVDHPEKVAKEERLDEEMLAADLAATGKISYVGAKADAIVNFVKEKAQTGDVVLVMSNGGFEGIHEKILQSLKERS